MKAVIYYQDFSLNARNLDDKIVFLPEKATKVKELGNCEKLVKEQLGPMSFPDLVTKQDMAAAIYQSQNLLFIPKGHPDRAIYEKAGHTSMSTGDYIIFEDGEVWIVKRCGWEIKDSKMCKNWLSLEDVPIDEDECIDCEWNQFQYGTPRFDI